jgi:hypothetical protein
MTNRYTLCLVLLSCGIAVPATRKTNRKPIIVLSPQTVEAHSAGLLFATPSVLRFGNQALKNTSAPQTITLSNTGSAELTIENIKTDSADFDFVSDCGELPSILQPAGTCTIVMRFTPTTSGRRNGSLTIHSSAGPPFAIPLEGNAVESAIALSATYVLFRPQLVNTRGMPQVLTLSNHSSTMALSIHGIDVPPDFTLLAMKNQCQEGSTIAPLASCGLTLIFAPKHVGLIRGTLTIADSDNASPHIVALSGVAMGVKLSTATLQWEAVEVGIRADPKGFELSNLSNNLLRIDSIEARGDFLEQNTCGSRLDEHQSCSVTVVFKPTTAGKSPGAIVIRDSDPTKMQTVLLFGTGATLGVLPKTLVFGEQKVGTVSPQQSVIFTNHGSSDLRITAINVSGDFVMPHKTCGSALAAGQSCQISISFSPNSAGEENGVLSIEGTGTLQQKVSLSGKGR